MKQEEKAEKAGHHDVKNFFAGKAIGQPCKNKSQQNGHGQNHPDFDEWNGLSSRIFGRDDQGIFRSTQQVIVERDQKENRKHRQELLELKSIDWPEEGAPFAEFSLRLGRHTPLEEGERLIGSHISSFLRQIGKKKKIFAFKFIL